MTARHTVSAIREAMDARAWPRLAVMAAIGAGAGLAVRLILVGDDDGPGALRATGIIAVVTLAGGLLLLWPARRGAAGVAFAAALAAVCALLTLWRGHVAGGDIGETATAAWLVFGWPVFAWLALTLGVTALGQGRLRWPYGETFDHAVTGPVAAAAGLAAALVISAFLALWSVAFGYLGVSWMEAALASFWLLLPAAGTAGALGAALAQGEARLRGVGEAVLLIGARIVLPLLAVFSAVFVAMLPFTGLEGLSEELSPSGVMMVLALAAIVVFNGVYRDGSRPPPALLRWASWLLAATLPVFSACALYGVSARIGQHGLTPARVIAFIAAAMCCAYSLVLLAGLASEFRRRAGAGGPWMPPVAGLNVRFAFACLAVLALMQTPVLDPLVLSARDQAGRLRSGATGVEEFDFAHMRFQLGRPGMAALDRMEGWTDHPEAAAIASRVAFVREAETYWEARRYEARAGGQAALPAVLQQRLDLLRAQFEGEERDYLQRISALADDLRTFACSDDMRSLDGATAAHAAELLQALRIEMRSINYLSLERADLIALREEVRDKLDAECDPAPAAPTSN